LTIGAGIARMCVIIAEMIAASNGLGYMIQINRLMVNTPQVILGMICIGCIGFVMNKLII
jgi:ABC-type nitrate/sulfonate/bicarbonate transport system permease component